MSTNPQSPAAASTRLFAWVQPGGLAAGPVVAAVLMTTLSGRYVDMGGEPAILTYAGRATLATMAWMSIWWFTEATDITVTALLPMALFPLWGIMDVGATCAPYADKIIFLFMGGFVLALSMQRWGLGKRIALVTLLLVGTRPANMIGGFMLITAVISAFVSNAATVAMMLPIAISVVAIVCPQADEPTATHRPIAGSPAKPTGDREFACCLMLAVAYAGSVGGIATIIGTPPNVLAVSFLRGQVAEAYRLEIGFAQWMCIGVPVSMCMLVSIWVLLTRFLFRLPTHVSAQGATVIRAQLASMGRVQRGEWVTLSVFLVTVAAWLMQPALAKWTCSWHGRSISPLAGLSDTTIVMSAALLLFLIPAEPGSGKYVMDWQTARHLPWNVLLLFGGGLSLASAVQQHGVAEYMGSKLNFLAGQPPWLIVMLIVTFVVFLTELTSNTATTASLLPVLAALAPALHMDPAQLSIAAAIAASCAFMLPVATPPNAIVFGSGEVTLPQMARAGLWVNLIAIACITLFNACLIAPLLASWRT